MRLFLTTGILAASLMSVSGGQAGELKEMNAAPIALASMNGVAYYTNMRDGYRVVATFADDRTGQPIRFIATLLDGQSVLVAVPQGVGEPAHEMEIVREAGKVFVRAPLKELAAAAK